MAVYSSVDWYGFWLLFVDDREKVLRARFLMIFKCLVVDESSFAQITGIRFFSLVEEAVAVQRRLVGERFAARVAHILRATQMECYLVLVL